ncbi:hypothetical protein [Clostridium peptidivorans]|uniref:hypothetical protein n=1 Tax=Clostridium peptidivorans TaxID=100174 RepID=UPI000BE2758D|nr:hypothetical protein [Clostridium peptidivorans]
MKKIGLIFLAVALLIAPSTVKAADALTRMLHADEVKEFRQDQDALIIGQLMSKEDGIFTVKVCKVISGKVKEEVIPLRDFQYGWGTGEELQPEISDFAVMSIKKEGSIYKKVWGMFKATSGDFKTLKLITKEMRYTYGESEVAAVEWYINSRGKEDDFFFINDDAYVRRPNGQEIKIYPKSLEALNNIVTPEEQQLNENNKIKDSSFIKTGIALLLTVPIIYAVFRIKNREASKEK